MPFIQVIEFVTTATSAEELRALADEYLASTEGRRTVVRGMMCADRDSSGRFVNIVEFASYEEAMENSNLPETTAFAQRMLELSDGPATFRNLDVIHTYEG